VYTFYFNQKKSEQEKRKEKEKKKEKIENDAFG